MIFLQQACLLEGLPMFQLLLAAWDSVGRPWRSWIDELMTLCRARESWPIQVSRHHILDEWTAMQSIFQSVFRAILRGREARLKTQGKVWTHFLVWHVLFRRCISFCDPEPWWSITYFLSRSFYHLNRFRAMLCIDPVPCVDFDVHPVETKEYIEVSVATITGRAIT